MMAYCENHPERTSSYRIYIDGVAHELCLTCRLALLDETEEEEDE